MIFILSFFGQIHSLSIEVIDSMAGVFEDSTESMLNYRSPILWSRHYHV